MEITYEQIKEILAETARKQVDFTNWQQGDFANWKAEMQQINSEIQRTNAETARLVNQNNKQLGELGNKLGSFAEGLAYPTVERIMREQLGLTSVSQNQKIEKGGDTLEIDAFGYSNGSTNRVVAGEIKSHFRIEDIEQLEKNLLQNPRFHARTSW